jgi:small nuclear ribonucleoprotein (snRNP)-like protein
MLIKSAKRAAAVVLAALLPAASQAQAFPSLGIVPPARQQEAAPRAQLDPALRGRKVVVYLRDARAYEGKVVAVDADSLSLQVKEIDPATGKKVKQTRTLAAADIALIERRGADAPLWVATAVGGLPGRGALEERRREKDQQLSAVLPPQAGQPLQVNPAVVGREVVVTLQSGGVLRGKLLEATSQEMLLRVPTQAVGATTLGYSAERVVLRDASAVDLVRPPRRTRGHWWLAPVVLGGLLAGVIALVAAGMD